MTEDSQHAEDALRAAAFDWLIRLRDNPDNALLEDEFSAWLSESDAHRAAYRSVERVWQLSGALSKGDRDRSAQSVAIPESRNSIGKIPPAYSRRGSRRIPRRRRIAVLGAAAMASCLALAALPTVQRHLQADYVTGVGEMREVSLDDGSTVILNGDSAIAVHYGSLRRDVALLSGQAYFRVVHAPGRPFIITSGQVRTTVTGTEFAVDATPDTVTVELRTGGVDVSHGADRKNNVRLASGESVTVDRATGRFSKGQVAAADVAAWREGRLVVDGMPLADVARALDRHYPGRIVIPDGDFSQRRITGIFDLSHPADAIAAAVQAQHGSTRRITPWLIVVTAP